ncbi:ribosome small subunit-dependent GTPase A [Azonexus sp. R2A61]|uniref:ribosome small subunit-dependent GTPase A n=1 Tax=Azonexus sp. R2A61 TaxID=2744443 RepID=UPI001F3875BF|nr:ribosome small subunit-dependent GTPase A [Azonexus sp. R2A61]
MRGRVVAAHGRQYFVEVDDGRRLPCFPRGKKSDIACGDEVEVGQSSADQGVIEAILPRRSLLYRSNEIRQKLIAANVDQMIVVVAVEPAFSDDLVTRALIAAESQGIEVLIVLNKADLSDRLPLARQQTEIFRQLAYPVIELSARHGADILRDQLATRTSVLVGQSGMGKSTLINALIPDAGAATREISQALDSGKHTTTHATLYRLADDSFLIDSPGLQEFGLGHLTLDELELAFREFRPFLGQCRFRNCRHDREPDCALQAALASGEITAGRFASYRRLAGLDR